MPRPIHSWLFSALAAGLLVLAGCSSKNDFDGGIAKSILETNAVNLDGEQVSLTPMQLDCGVQSELWDAPAQVSQDRTTARLTEKGRELNFSDDPAIESDFQKPYVQIRGAFSLEVTEMSNVRDGETSGVKLVDGKAGIKLQHSCFSASLPLMGVKKGKFREDAPVTFQFALKDDGWHFENVVH